jgi:hypothetical protein
VDIVVSLVTSVPGSDDYQRACTRRETPIEGTDFFGSLPKRNVLDYLSACFAAHLRGQKVPSLLPAK